MFEMILLFLLWGDNTVPFVTTSSVHERTFSDRRSSALRGS